MSARLRQQTADLPALPGLRIILRASACRRFGICLAMGLLLFGTSAGLWHHHDSASDTDAACQICHVAHLSLVQTQLSADLPKPLAVTQAAPIRALHPQLDPVTHHSSPRAPPA